MIPKNPTRHNELLDGRAGLANVGKVISTQIERRIEACAVASQLVELNWGFACPAVQPPFS
jgi:hypothetical protein